MKNKNVTRRYRFDNAAELREVLDQALSGLHADTVLPDQGPMTLNIIEETLSDRSVVVNFAFSVMTEAQIKREAE